jgi:hypothetical protein
MHRTTGLAALPPTTASSSKPSPTCCRKRSATEAASSLHAWRAASSSRLADRRAGRPLALEAEGGDLRAGHLPDPDARFVAQRQQREIHRRKTGGAPVAHIG